MTIEELKKAKENKTPVFVDRSWRFSHEKTIITDVQENEPLGGIVKVEGGDQWYEGYRVRIAGNVVLEKQEAPSVKKSEVEELKNQVRAALADYVRSEGCSCCQDRDAHEQAADKLGELLDIDRYEDNSGVDFYKYSKSK